MPQHCGISVDSWWKNAIPQPRIPRLVQSMRRCQAVIAAFGSPISFVSKAIQQRVLMFQLFSQTALSKPILAHFSQTPAMFIRVFLHKVPNDCHDFGLKMSVDKQWIHTLIDNTNRGYLGIVRRNLLEGSEFF